MNIGADYSTISEPVWFQLCTLMQLYALYILVIYHAIISYSFKVIAFLYSHYR